MSGYETLKLLFRFYLINIHSASKFRPSFGSCKPNHIKWAELKQKYRKISFGDELNAAFTTFKKISWPTKCRLKSEIDHNINSSVNFINRLSFKNSTAACAKIMVTQ